VVEAKDKEIGEFKNKIKDQSDKMILSGGLIFNF
jgi:hypothetical protein